MFRNETNDVVLKAQTKQDRKISKKGHAPSPGTRSPDASAESSSLHISKLWTPGTTENSLIGQSLNSTLEDQGTGFFFHNYIIESSKDSRGHLDYLPLPSQIHRNSTLSIAVASIGMAALSNVRNDPNIMAKARLKYMSALRLTNATLRDPIQAREDQTLTAVILLSMFEVSLTTITSCIIL